jgi:mono/diheme cytochrome c family protein
MKDPYQRSLEIYEFRTTATGGAQRGEELFYFKCSFCHNRYGKRELLRGLVYAPPLEDLHRRSKPLQTGEPANTQTVAAKIKNGGPAMPAYRHTLTDADVADLVAYIFGGKCCVDGENPPPNPRYRKP